MFILKIYITTELWITKDEKQIQKLIIYIKHAFINMVCQRKKKLFF